jgi:hypothetical protein
MIRLSGSVKLRCALSSGELPLAAFDFQSKNKTAGLEYHSPHPRIIRAGLMALAVCQENFTFIDFGCGKGRVLLVASEFPFRRIIGLEFAPLLAETARRNLESYRTCRRKCSSIEVITVDATEYELTAEPQVLYFYSPFARSVMDQIVQNIEVASASSPGVAGFVFRHACQARQRLWLPKTIRTFTPRTLLRYLPASVFVNMFLCADLR